MNPGFTINIPKFECYVRAEYLYNLESHKGEFIPCRVIAADSIYGRAIGFDLYIDNGAMFTRLPCSALVHKTDAPDMPLADLQLWNCFSYSMEAIPYTAIKEADCEVRIQNKWLPGSYMFTFSWYGNEDSEEAGDSGYKRAHMIALKNGCYCLQPNNRIRLKDASFITKPFPEKPDYKTNTHIWSVESERITEDSDIMFYEVITPGKREDLNIIRKRK